MREGFGSALGTRPRRVRREVSTVPSSRSRWGRILSPPLTDKPRATSPAGSSGGSRSIEILTFSRVPRKSLRHLTPSEFIRQRQEDRALEGAPLQLQPVS